MSYRALLALVLAVLLCAGSPAALAQSPGDEQYQDPFGSDGDGGEQEPAATPEPTPAPTAAPAPAQEPAPTGAEPASEPAPTAPSGASGGGGELPRTGAPVALVVAAGAALMAGGLALRRRTGGGDR